MALSTICFSFLIVKFALIIKLDLKNWLYEYEEVLLQ